MTGMNSLGFTKSHNTSAYKILQRDWTIWAMREVKGYTLGDLAKTFGLTRQRIDQILRNRNRIMRRHEFMAEKAIAARAREAEGKRLYGRGYL